MSNRKILLGIDEVGRGPWAGPLVVGAVILGATNPAWEQLTDSKKLTSKRRNELNQLILQQAAATGLGWISSREVDQYGLSQSLRFAARLAVTNLLKQGYPDKFANLDNLANLSTSTDLPFDEIIIDGTINFLADTPLGHYTTTLPKADFLVKEVSAASIIAKVARDDYMVKLSTQHPEYGFERHVGYGTAQHRQALQEFGICPEHRQSFRPVQQFLINAQEPKTTTTTASTSSLGSRAETTVINYLRTHGHQIIAHNYKTPSYEIDIISRDQTTIYFTEVKYRRIASHGSAFAQINTAKQRQMRYAARAFLASHTQYLSLQPLLAAAAVSGTDFQLQEWFTLT